MSGSGRAKLELELLIPFYGAPRYLFDAIAAVQALEETDWLLTIVEDCYPDGEVVERKVAGLGDDRIRYLRNESNLGVNANVHRCIQLAEREHFVITGLDDMVLPNYGRVVGRMLARHPDAALIQPAVQVVDEDGVPYLPLPDRVKMMSWPRKESVMRGESAVRSLLRGNWLYTPALLYRRDAIQRTPFRDGIDAAHDLAFVVDVLLDGGSLVVGTEMCFSYRRHRASHSSYFARTGSRFEQERRYFDEIRSEVRGRGWRSAELAARLRLLSRLNAATQLPHAVRSGKAPAVRSLLSHVLG